MFELATTFHAIDGVDCPCADISCSGSDLDHVEVLMHFSRVTGGLTKDLSLTFDGVLALRWMDEAAHSVSGLMPGPLPKCQEHQWQNWVYPILTVSHSKWLKSFDFLPAAKGRAHYALISMNHIVEVIGKPPAARWVPPHEV
jgi:hypothetical protein